MNLQNKTLPANIIFFGTSEFAIPVLEELLKNNIQPVLVVTTPDKPSGRGKKLTPSFVKIYCSSHKLALITPDDLKSEEILNTLKKTDPDIFVIASYGKIIPSSLLQIPKKGTLNVHPSLLPKYRGPSPIQSAIMSGDTITGVTIMLTDEQMDHGPILKKAEYKIGPKTTTKYLKKNLAELGGRILVETIQDRLEENTKPKEQDHASATFTKKISKKDGHLNWSGDADIIEKKIRALNPWPGTYCFWETNGKQTRLIITEAEVADYDHHDRAPGTVFKTEGEIGVVTGKNAIIIKKIKPEGRNEMTAENFLRGHPDIEGSQLK
ncbi:MAG: methionyl-tRNA formyltransferase [Candidatus Niyogibacteria bacterium CG10_big_fil_rev_8_21_14_0_10_42_19]|uniref:Methionyl-tRNA formyltransferase n=1 Tax=Candidatus Niyogibacteria bacterium CG10_big_fil_rev_8_21_14_0_10_42_19 TaxID=1974725 RepID=A0A2H0TFV0_9BACT|nr:MAG: methionyl-tRNA formyltransferase [Candidatus Niyogibacteria bacterium CG10_big_fil_rev_8_21_14_0_10_42_19]